MKKLLTAAVIVAALTTPLAAQTEEKKLNELVNLYKDIFKQYAEMCPEPKDVCEFLAFTVNKKIKSFDIVSAFAIMHQRGKLEFKD